MKIGTQIAHIVNRHCALSSCTHGRTLKFVAHHCFDVSYLEARKPRCNCAPIPGKLQILIPHLFDTVARVLKQAKILQVIPCTEELCPWRKCMNIMCPDGSCQHAMDRLEVVLGHEHLSDSVDAVIALAKVLLACRWHRPRVPGLQGETSILHTSILPSREAASISHSAAICVRLILLIRRRHTYFTHKWKGCLPVQVLQVAHLAHSYEIREYRAGRLWCSQHYQPVQICEPDMYIKQLSMRSCTCSQELTSWRICQLN